jgi:preprotein translocase SecE subunit
VARNRQRAKQRQAARRAARERKGDGKPARQDKGDGAAAELERYEHTVTEPDPLERADLAAGAPPEDLGRTDRVFEEGPAEAEELPDYDVEDEEQPLEEPRAAGPVGRRGGRVEEERHERGRLIGFLVNVVAELRRVQWPNRQQVVTLTGVVLGFVLIAGGYLGALDAIFSRVVEAIL